MKKTLLVLLLVVPLIIMSCSSDGDEPVEDPIIEDENSNDDDDDDMTTVKYGDISSIINTNCNSCHGNPTANAAPMSLTTYDEMVNAVNNRNLANRIQSSSNPMPPASSGGLMAQSNIDLILDWIDQGMVEN